MSSVTTNLKLNVPAFDQVPWDVDVNTNWLVLDAAVGMFSAIPNLVGVWKNATAYTYGQSTIDSTDSSIWTCIQTHTSMPAPNAFSLDRTTNPGRWAMVSNGAEFYANAAADSAAAAKAAADAAAASAAAAVGALPLTGGTMTGPLILAADPVNVLGAATRQYVDARVGGVGYLPITGGVLTGPLTAGATGIAYGNVTVADRRFISFGWNGTNLYAGVDGTNVGNLVTQAYVTGAFLPITGGSVNGTLYVAGESQTASVFRITSSGAYFYSDANYTYLRMDSGGWTLRYVRATGALQYLRSDFALLFQIDGSGNTSTYHDHNVGANLVAAGNLYARGGSVLFGAGDRSVLASDNSTYTTFKMLDNYQWYFNWSTGGLSWVRWDGVQSFTIDNGGSIACIGNASASGNMYAVGSLYASSQQMVFGPGGDGRIMQMGPSYYWDWNTSNGTLAWFRPSGAYMVLDASANIISNANGPFAGHGGYQDVSDLRTKTDVQPSIVGLAEVIRLSPIKFTRIGNDHEEEGFSAQDVQPVLPTAVREVPGYGTRREEDTVLSVTLGPIVAALVNGMKELAARMSALENK